jgi:hypothetical protein
MVSLLWVTYPDEKNVEWSHCYAWPTQMEKTWRGISLLWVTYPDGKNVKSDLIVMGDLPRWKKIWKAVSLLWMTYPGGKNMKNKKWSHCYGWPTLGENTRIFQNCLIVMGVLPRAKMKILKGTTW